MPVSFVAYIDESGDTGLETIKPIDGRGATEWLVLSWIYWWLARLERVTKFCERLVPIEDRGTEKLRIIFSRRADLKYKNFEEYLWRLRWQSHFGELLLDTGDLSWSVIDFPAGGL